jgi:hypothetical protein
MRESRYGAVIMGWCAGGVEKNRDQLADLGAAPIYARPAMRPYLSARI